MDLRVVKFAAWSLLLLSTACAGSVRPEAVAPAPAQVQGVLSGETVLAGDVLLTGDVLVPAGSRLVIEAGTTVRILAAESTKIDPEYLFAETELLVRGELVVRGTSEAPVLFAPTGVPEDREVGWAGIIFDGGAGSVEGAVIEEADSGVLCIRSAPLLQGNRLRRCRYGIIAQQDSAPRILGNTVEDGEGGIFCWRGSAPYLKDNVLAGNREEGIYVDADSRPFLDRNEVRGNSIGLALADAALPYDGTAISGNSTDVLILAGEGGR